MVGWFWQRKPEVFGEKRALVPLRSAQNSIWPGIDSAFRGQGPATNRLNHGMGHEYGYETTVYRS
jgi:hypothetical protein